MRLVLFIIFLTIAFTGSSQNYYLFIGGYNDKSPGKGIFVYEFNAATGKAKWISNTEDRSIINPSYFALGLKGKCLYACTDTRTAGAGSVTAFAFDRKEGKLNFINKQLSGGDNPVYVSVHKNGRWVVIGNYTGGSLSVYAINKDGSLQPFAQNIQHVGSSIRPNQNKPHVHSVVFSPANDYLFVPDLGMDKIMTYRFKDDALKPLKDEGFTAITPGGGPRHFIFHPNGKYTYLLEEMGGAVMVYKYNAAKGKLDSLQRILSHDEDSTGAFHSADIHISPDGKFLYASNRTRQHNIAIYSIDVTTGKLRLVGYEPTQG